LYILHTAFSVKQNKCPGEVAARFDEAEGPRDRDWRSSTVFNSSNGILRRRERPRMYKHEHEQPSEIPGKGKEEVGG
jgi:hypothetical protein